MKWLRNLFRRRLTITISWSDIDAPRGLLSIQRDDQSWEVFGSYLLNSDTAEGFKSYDVDRK